MASKNSNRKEVKAIISEDNKKDVFSVKPFRTASCEFKGYPVSDNQFKDGISDIDFELIQLNNRIVELKQDELKRIEKNKTNKIMVKYAEAMNLFNSMPEKIRKALNVKAPVKPGFKSIQSVSVSVKTEGNTKRDLNKVFQAILNDNKDGLTKSESAYASQLKSVYNAMCNKGKGDLNTALANTLGKSLDEKLAALKAYADKAGKDTFYRNNSPYVKTLQVMIDDNK